MRYRLRTLLILLAILPPISWGLWSGVVAYREWLGRKYVQNALP
jgi:hypothetical protein